MEQLMDCNTNMSSRGEFSIQYQACHQIVVGNEILNVDDENPTKKQDINICKNDAALEVQMATPDVQNDLIQNVMAFYDDAVYKNQSHSDSEDKTEINFGVITKENISAENEVSDGEIEQNIDARGKVVTLPIGNNQNLCLSVMSKLGGDINCVRKDDHGPIPTVFFHITTADGSCAMFRAKVEAYTEEPQIATSGSTNPFIDKEYSDIAADTISEMENLVKKFKTSSLNQAEYEKLKIVAKALDAEEKKVH